MKNNGFKITPAKYKLLWTITLMAAIYWGGQYYVNNWCITKKLPRDIEYLNIIEDKINPNNAAWPSLARLPGIGESLAKAIVQCRQKNKTINKKCFNKVADLAKVKGIGPGKCQQMEPYLIF